MLLPWEEKEKQKQVQMMRALDCHPTVEREIKEYGVDLGSYNVPLMFKFICNQELRDTWAHKGVSKKLLSILVSLSISGRVGLSYLM